MEVTKIPFNHGSGTLEVEYDGKEHSYSESFWYDESALLPGHKVVVTSYPTMTKVGSTTNKIIFNIVAVDENGNEVDMTKVYDHSGDYRNFGKLIVTKKTICVTTDSHTWYYDGQAHSCKTEGCAGYTVTSGLLEGHTITINLTASVTNIPKKPVENTFNPSKDVVILDENGNDVTNCYKFEITAGLLNVLFNPDNV